MKNSAQCRCWPLSINWFASAGLAIAIVFALATALPQSAQAQTFTVLHAFTGGTGGYYPGAGITSDSSGNLYGAAAFGGVYNSNCDSEGTRTGCGVVYRMSHRGSGWTFNILYSFDGTDGYNPGQLITVASDGSLYSTAYWGGTGNCNGFAPGCGTVFRLQPPPTFCRAVLCPWTGTELHDFLGGTNDGALPVFGSLTFDAAGNLYGTTQNGGAYGYGIVYELSRNGNGWSMSVLHDFGGPNDVINPWGGVIFDNAGNMYGTASQGGSGLGVVFELTPSGSGWNETILHNFNYETDGAEPSGNLVMDASGNLYGTTRGYGPNGGGTIWEISPANGGWDFSVLHAFVGGNPGGPLGGLLRDSAGNLYGAAVNDGAHEWGSVFKLSPSNGGWNYTDLYDFTGGSDGGLPYSNVAMDAGGNIYGVTEVGGALQDCPSGCGVVFEIAP